MTDWTEPASRIALAVLAGGLVGLNRDLRGKPTGVRVHSLVSLGAALFVLSVSGGQGAEATAAVSRIIQGIVGGIGFLGAGVILRGGDGKHIYHVTTAASIWVTAAMGVLCGLAAWPLIVISLVAVLIILVVGRAVDRALHGRFGHDEEW